MRAKQGPGVMTTFTCGRRMFTLFTVGGQGAERLHARVLATVLCLPDPAREAAPLAGVPIAIETPAGWERDDSDPLQLNLSGDGATMSFFKVADNVDVVAFLRSILEQNGLTAEFSALPDAGGRAWWSMRIEGETPGDGFLVRWPCGGSQLAGFYLGDRAARGDAAGVDGAPAVDGRALLTGARCK